MNNSIYQNTSKEPQSMLKATKCLIKVLDTKYEKADFRAIIKDDCHKHLSTPEQSKLLELLQEIPEASVCLKISGCVIEIVQVQEQVIKMVKLYQPS